MSKSGNLKIEYRTIKCIRDMPDLHRRKGKLPIHLLGGVVSEAPKLLLKSLYKYSILLMVGTIVVSRIITDYSGSCFFQKGKNRYFRFEEKYMAFFTTAIDGLKTVVIAIGAGLGVWGIVNLLEGYGNDNPGAKSQGIKQLMAGCGIAIVALTVIPQLSTLFGTT